MTEWPAYQQHEVAAFGHGVLQPDFIKCVGEDLPPFVIFSELCREKVPLCGLLETSSSGLLQRRVGAEDDASAGSQCGLNNGRRADEPAHPPSGSSEGL